MQLRGFATWWLCVLVFLFAQFIAYPAPAQQPIPPDALAHFNEARKEFDAAKKISQAERFKLEEKVSGTKKKP